MRSSWWRNAVFYQVYVRSFADANDDGELNLTDPITLLRRLFLGGDPLPPPGPACGADPTPDGLAECAATC